MNASDRMAKLRRLADHPATPPHEAALARQMLERMERAHPGAEEPDLNWLKVGRSRDPIEFARLFREQMIRDAHCYFCGIRIARPWAETISPVRCPKHLLVLVPGDKGYYAWARERTVGERLEIRHTCQDPKHVRDFATIVRMTETQYEMDSRRRYRRKGHCPGYQVGEDGRTGRFFIVSAVAEG